MKKSFVFVAVAIILLLLIILKILNGCKKENLQAVVPAVPLVQAECYLVRDTVVAFPLKAVGNIRANEKVDIVSELPGRIITVTFKEGSVVKRESLLFNLDDSEYTASLKKCMAQLELAYQSEERNADLLASGGISRHIFDESVSHRKVLEADAEALRVLISKTKIKAPFSGKTGLRHVSPGAYVKPGEVLTSLEDLSILKVEFTVPQNNAGLIKVNERFQFSTAGNPKLYEAVVEASDPSVDRKTGNLRVLARVTNPAANLVAGSAVTMSMVNRTEIPALYVPTQALLPTPAGYNLYLLRAGISTLKEVKTGLRSENMVEVTEGISSGDTVLVTGLMRIRPGQRIKITKIW